MTWYCWLGSIAYVLLFLLTFVLWARKWYAEFREPGGAIAFAFIASLVAPAGLGAWLWITLAESNKSEAPCWLKRTLFRGID